MRKYLSMVIFVIMIIGFSACEKFVIVPPEVNFESYSTSIQPIFDADCVSCHSGGLSPNLSNGASFVSLTTGGYINLDEPEASLIYEKLQGSHKAYTLDANKEMILAWISEGAPND